MTNEAPQDPRLFTYYHAMAVLTPKEREESAQRGVEKWAKIVEEEDNTLLDNGFAIFGKAPAAQRKDAFMKQTAQSDIWRCLLTENYEAEYKAGAPPPDSPLWRILLQVGGWHWFHRFRKEFISAWNSVSRDLGLHDQVYER